MALGHGLSVQHKHGYAEAMHILHRMADEQEEGARW